MGAICQPVLLLGGRSYCIAAATSSATSICWPFCRRPGRQEHRTDSPMLRSVPRKRGIPRDSSSDSYGVSRGLRGTGFAIESVSY
jgi:hypothetical protein